MDASKKYFTSRLLQWNTDVNDRHMPWKGEKNPYKIWLSEVILQQTRVEQGWEYYNRFVAAFPTIMDLAKAPDTQVFKLWEGLGYYTRCKNLLATARYIADECRGQFPDQYEDILALKGVGPYTAAAIASFAYNLPHAVVDGNVFRVLSRFFANNTPVDSTEGKRFFTALANELLDKKQPGIYNQALMDFGAVVCKPQLPLCTQCPLQKKCGAYLTGMVSNLPVKEKTIVQRTRWFFYFVMEYKGRLYVRKRGAKDIWENLYEFVLLESPAPTDMEEVKRSPGFKKMLTKNAYTAGPISKIYSQKLTHQTIHGQFARLHLKNAPELEGYEAVTEKELELLPFPKLITSYLKDKNVSLNLL
ncbi:A/G-specific adenine glycosylase [Ferruginibacter sp.]